jgi:hypothetical protein
MDFTTFIIVSTGFLSGAAGGAATLPIIMAAKRRTVDDQPYKTSFSFSGNLRQTPLLDAVQFLEISRREGVMHIFSKKRKGYLVFVKGHVADAFYRNFVRREALFAMLDLTEGDFYFEPKIISQPKLITDTFMDIALEWGARKAGSE